MYICSTLPGAIILYIQPNARGVSFFSTNALKLLSLSLSHSLLPQAAPSGGPLRASTACMRRPSRFIYSTVMEYEEVENTALVPVKGSVPACSWVTYRDLLTPSLVVR